MTHGWAEPLLGEEIRRIAVVGAGYVGLPTAAVLSSRGHFVTVAERDKERYQNLRDGLSSNVEQGLDELLNESMAAGRLKVVNSAAAAVVDAEFVFLCVETPQNEDGSADLSFVTGAAMEIGPKLATGTIIVNKSTVPMGTVGLIEQVIGRPDIVVVSNPEFLREGSAIADSFNPDRIVVGASDREAAAQVAKLFCNFQSPVVITDATTSELIKYASNAFLATKLTFVNAMASLCEVVGASADDLVLGIGYDKRIGFEFLHPGPGWGGSCLPKDTAALVAIAKSAGFDAEIVRAAIDGNQEHMKRVADKIRVAVGGEIRGSTIGVLGLTFKANTEDRRNSPSISITQRLVDMGAVVKAYDPSVSSTSAEATDLAHLTVCNSPYEAMKNTNAIAILTEWPMFRELDFVRVRESVATPVIIDARNILDVETLKRLGFSYSSVGRQ
jgi:UDPglucose 6-dehydrogenase